MVSDPVVLYSLGLVLCLRRSIGLVLAKVSALSKIMVFSTVCKEESSGVKRRIYGLILSVALSTEREEELYKDFKLLCFLVSPIFHISPSFLLVFN